MSPLMWLNLFMMFITSLALFTVLHYFIFPAKKTYIFPEQPKKLENWKW